MRDCLLRAKPSTCQTSMRTISVPSTLLLILALLGSSCTLLRGDPDPDRLISPGGQNVPGTAPFATNVALKSATGATISFKARDSQEVRKIPYLVLNRNGVTTPMTERMLRISVGDLHIPPSGLYVKLEIATQHMDPEQGGRDPEPIRFWEQKSFLAYSPDRQEPRSIDFMVVFPGIFTYRGRAIRTPTDYYTYRVTVLDGRGNFLRQIEQPYAFLLENQWRVPLPKVLEATPGAAPQELVIYSCDMFPFQSNMRNEETQVPRQDIEHYLETELIPAMLQAFKFQSDLWGLPWYAEWTSYRPEDDPKTLSVALGENGTWYHGAAPSLGHAMISIRVDGSFVEYNNITDGIMSVFHHELFHNQQRNLSLHFGGLGDVSGKGETWELVSEGTAVLASLVGEPGVQMYSSIMPRSYLRRANSFIGQDGVFNGGLNQNYYQIPYHTVLYWRFLYEQCGGIRRIVDDPSAGMKPIRQVLETLYGDEIADLESVTPAIEVLPSLIDVALYKTPTCPFHSFEESLVHFTRAIYLLRREEGRCPAPHPYAWCGFYDPGGLYSVPNAESHTLVKGDRNRIDGSIPSNFGLDLLELNLDPSMDGDSLRLFFKSTSGPGYEYQVELWGRTARSAKSAAAKYEPAFDGPLFSERTHQGSLVLEIPRLNLDQIQALDLVVTRLDTRENTATSGQYAIRVVVD